jgi:hypothetical protein
MHDIRHTGGAEVQLYSFLTFALSYVTGQLHGLQTLEKKKILDSKLLYAL